MSVRHLGCRLRRAAAVASGRAPPGMGMVSRRWCATDASAKEATLEMLQTPEKHIAPPPISKHLQCSVRAMAEAVRKGEVSSETLVKESIKQLQLASSYLNLITSISTQALATAKALDEVLQKRGKPIGPLHGIPVLVHDDIHVAGLPTTMGTAALSSFVPSKSAPVIQCLQAAGAVVVGKANMDELGMGYLGLNDATGSTSNPFNPDLSSGGSCSGAAAAVLLECVPFALGTDVTGELRIPASFCGTYGFVPSKGRYSRNRVWLLAKSLGSVGVLAKNVGDLHLIDNVLSASTIEDESSMLLAAARPPAPLDHDRVQLVSPTCYFTDSLSPEVELAYQLSIELLRKGGVQFLAPERDLELLAAAGIGQMRQEEEVEKPRIEDPDLMMASRAQRVSYQMVEYETAGRLRGVCKQAGVPYQELEDQVASREVAERLKSFKSLPASFLADGQAAAKILHDSLTKYFDKLPASVDAVIIPTTITMPPRSADVRSRTTVMWKNVRIPVQMLSRNCFPVTLVGHPCITIPAARRLREGGSTGLMLVGRKGDDQRLLAVAAEVDQRLREMAVRFEEIRKQRITESAFGDSSPVLPDMPSWLDDRTANEAAFQDDYRLLKDKEGRVHHTLMRYIKGTGGKLTEQQASRHVNKEKLLDEQALAKAVVQDMEHLEEPPPKQQPQRDTTHEREVADVLSNFQQK